MFGLSGYVLLEILTTVKYCTPKFLADVDGVLENYFCLVCFGPKEKDICLDSEMHVLKKIREFRLYISPYWYYEQQFKKNLRSSSLWTCLGYMVV